VHWIGLCVNRQTLIFALLCCKVITSIDQWRLSPPPIYSPLLSLQYRSAFIYSIVYYVQFRYIRMNSFRFSLHFGFRNISIQYNADLLVRLYKSLVRRHLEYCVSAWSAYIKDSKLLQSVCNTGSQEWCLNWRSCDMKKDWNIWNCGPLKREETEPTYWKFSGCIKVYQPLHSTATLFCKLLHVLVPEDIIIIIMLV